MQGVENDKLTNQPEPATNGGLAMSYLGLRKGIGFLGLALPIVLMVGKIWLDGGGIENSISAYYYTGMRNYFVGTMCAIGVFFTSYRYRREDNYLSDAVAAFAVGVALFPTTPAIASPTTSQTIVGYVHLTSASLFFLCLAYFSLFLFTK